MRFWKHIYSKFSRPKISIRMRKLNFVDEKYVLLGSYFISLLILEYAGLGQYRGCDGGCGTWL